MSRETNQEVYFEFRVIDHFMKGTAIDPQTLLEVSIVMPAHLSIDMAKKILLQKLKKKIHDSLLLE